MERVEIYTRPLCGYCQAAKSLLNKERIAFTEYDVLLDSTRKGEMLTRSAGQRTVPQIFIDGVSVGGFDELTRLDIQELLRKQPNSD